MRCNAGWRDWIVYFDTLFFVCESDYVRRCMQVGVIGSCIWTRCSLHVRVSCDHVFGFTRAYMNVAGGA